MSVFVASAITDDSYRPGATCRRGTAVTGPPVSFDDQVDDLVEVLDGEPAGAFGHSFGGDVVLAAAADHPELIPTALVWEPPQPWLSWWPGSKTGSVRSRFEVPLRLFSAPQK